MSAAARSHGGARSPDTAATPWLPSSNEPMPVATEPALGNFLFTLPHELEAGHHRQLRQLDQAAYRTFLLQDNGKAG